MKFFNKLHPISKVVSVLLVGNLVIALVIVPLIGLIFSSLKINYFFFILLPLFTGFMFVIYGITYFISGYILSRTKGNQVIYLIVAVLLSLFIIPVVNIVISFFIFPNASSNYSLNDILTSPISLNSLFPFLCAFIGLWIGNKRIKSKKTK